MSISKSLLVTGTFLLVSLPAFAQFGQVDGYIMGPDKKPVMGAVVSFDRLDRKDHTETKTDKKGYYQIATMPTGDYSITVTVDGQFRERRDFFHISPGRQNATVGNSALGLSFNLKPVEVVRAEQQKEVAKEQASGGGNAAADAEKAKAKQAQEESRKALMDAYGQGKAALDNKKYDEAIASLTKASELDPKQTAVWSSLAEAYVGLAQKQKSAEAETSLAKAEEDFSKAIELAPTNAGNYNDYALALAAGGKVDQAKEKLAKAIEIDPSGAGKYHYNLGAFLMNAGKSDDATEEFRKGIQADPNYAESYFYLGSMLAGKSTTDPGGKMIPPAGTIDALQKYLQLKPDGPNAQAAKDLITALGSKVDVNFKDPNAKKK